MKRRKIVVLGTALLPHFVASNGYAACVATSEIAVRARFVRCENASFYLEASGARGIYERPLEEILARTEPRFHEAVRERNGPRFARVHSVDELRRTSASHGE